MWSWSENSKTCQSWMSNNLTHDECFEIHVRKVIFFGISLILNKTGINDSLYRLQNISMIDPFYIPFIFQQAFALLTFVTSKILSTMFTLQSAISRCEINHKADSWPSPASDLQSLVCCWESQSRLFSFGQWGSTTSPADTH